MGELTLAFLAGSWYGPSRCPQSEKSYRQNQQELTFESHRPLAAPRNEQPSMHTGMHKDKTLDTKPFHSTQGLLPAIPPWSPSNLKKEDPKDGFFPLSIDPPTMPSFFSGKMLFRTNFPL